MPFDKTAFEFIPDFRNDLLQKKIALNKDNRSFEFQQIPPVTAPAVFQYTSAGVVIPAGTPNASVGNCWNDGSTTHAIEMYLSQDLKPNLSGCYLQIRYRPLQVRKLNAGAWQAASWIGYPAHVVANGVTTYTPSIPWNPLWWLQTVALKVNNQQMPLEQYIQPNFLQYQSTLKFLTSYKRAAIEADSTLFFPTVESSFDTYGAGGIISPESDTRSQFWLGTDGDVDDAVTATPVKEFTHTIPLSAIFECAKIPAIFQNITKMRLELLFKAPQDIAFNCGVRNNAVGVCSIVITDVKMIFDACRSTPQLAVEVADDKRNGMVENIAFMENSILPINYSGGSTQLVFTSQNMVQQCIVAFPALGLDVQVGGAPANPAVNPVTNPLQFWNGNLSTINLIYGSDQPSKQPIQLNSAATNAGTNSAVMNSLAYMLYRKTCALDNETYDACPITFNRFFPYHIYCFPIYSPYAAPYLNQDPKDIRVDVNSSGNTSISAIICARKLKTVQLTSLGDVETL